MGRRRGEIGEAALGAALACLVLASTACSAALDPSASDPADPVVAQVAGQSVHASDVRREAVATGAVAEGEVLPLSTELFRRTLDQVVDERLLAREARRLKVDRDPQVRRKLAAARDKIIGDALVEQVVNRAVTDQAVRSLYAEQQKLARRSEELRVRQILLATPTEAAAVSKLAAAGGDFATLAQQRSTDTASRFNGGDLGYFSLDAMPEGYAAVLRSARPGAVVGPLKVADGWAVLKVEDRRPETPILLSEAKPQIVRFLTYDEIKTLLSRLRKTAEIRVTLPPVAASGEPDSAPATTPAANKAAP